MSERAVMLSLDTPDDAERCAQFLERLAQLVRTRGPATVEITTSRQIIELPGAEGFDLDVGLEHATVDIRWG